MKQCTTDLLIKHGHPLLKKPYHSLHTNELPTHGAKAQCTDAPDELPKISTIDTRTMQAIIGSLLCYGRAVDNKLLGALSAIAMKTHSPTTFTRQEVHHLLDYVATCPDDGTMFRSSNMQLSAHSNAGCLNEPKAKSRASGHACPSKNVPISAFNGAILTIAQMIKMLM